MATSRPTSDDDPEPDREQQIPDARLDIDLHRDPDGDGWIAVDPADPDDQVVGEADTASLAALDYIEQLVEEIEDPPPRSRLA